MDGKGDIVAKCNKEHMYGIEFLRYVHIKWDGVRIKVVPGSIMVIVPLQSAISVGQDKGRSG